MLALPFKSNCWLEAENVSLRHQVRWEQVAFRTATLHVRRVKQGTPSIHPIVGDELRALRRLRREQEPKSPFVFTSERGAPFSTARSSGPKLVVCKAVRTA